MRVKIGPYLTWWGPYQIADLLQYVGVSEDRCQKIGRWLSNTRLNDLCQWIYDKRQRTIKVKIDYHDVFSADYTLALIILPVLKQYREKLNGSPWTDDQDVPDHLRSTNAPPFNPENGETDELFHQRWEWMVDEMIWAFEQIIDDDNDAQFHVNGYDHESHMKHEQRIKNGTTLFGKYYRGIWL